jgi:U3 small nucleolar RNA-associated protein 3
MGRTLAKKGGSAKKKGGHEDWMDDEIDDANRLRSKDKIGFDASDSEEEDPDAHMDTEGVMGIGADDSEDDSDLDSDEEEEEEDGEEDEDEDDDDDDDDDDLGSDEDEDEAALIRAMKAQQKKLASKGVKRADQDDSSSDEEEESEDDGLRIKGRKKSDFYGDEEVDHEGMSDEDERRDEEREARRLQQARAAGMSAADFGLSDEDESDTDESDSEPEEEATLGAKAAKLSAKGKKAEKESLKKKSKNSASLGAAVESLGGDELEAADGADAETGESPEVTALAKELTKNLDEVRNTIEPLCRYVREGNMVTKEGISYLDTKHLLMLSYCVNITFYMLLKAEGKPVKDHPVVLRLVEIRTYLEKLRPIDKKLKYQIDKLLKMAKDGVDGEEEDPTANGAGEDPLQFRPNPDALVSKVDEDAEEGAEGGVYRPPKMMPTAMEEFEEGGKSSKQKRAEKEARRRAQRSSLIKVRTDCFPVDCFPRSVSRLFHPFSSPPFASSVSDGTFVGSGLVEMRGDRSRDHMAYTNRTTPWAGYRSNAMSGAFPIKGWTFIIHPDLNPPSTTIYLPSTLTHQSKTRSSRNAGTRSRARGGSRGARRRRGRHAERLRQARIRPHGGSRQD